MARENKRKREERRFGRPSRLLDMILDPGTRWDVTKPYASMLDTADGRQELRDYRELRVRLLRKSVPVVCDNVCEYLFAINSQEEWQPARDFPSCKLPFQSCFLETNRPSFINSEGKRLSSSPLPVQWGWYCNQFDLSEFASIKALMSTLGRMPSSVSGRLFDGAESMLCGELYMKRDDKWLLPMVGSFFLPMNGAGKPLRNCEIVVPQIPGHTHEYTQRLMDTLNVLAFPMMLSLSFIHCKNVTLDPIDPDPAINLVRERAGLQPFVRYHTINIEPMKAALRTEGKIETNGLKKAMHICRGYFAEYTSDRPLFGREGAHGRFWIPAHVRGSSGKGVVVSDYRVKGPIQ